MPTLTKATHESQHTLAQEDKPGDAFMQRDIVIPSSLLNFEDVNMKIKTGHRGVTLRIICLGKS
eukprot:1094974-Pelagomonas_calceolata.AAC.1